MVEIFQPGYKYFHQGRNISTRVYIFKPGTCIIMAIYTWLINTSAREHPRASVHTWQVSLHHRFFSKYLYPGWSTQFIQEWARRKVVVKHKKKSNTPVEIFIPRLKYFIPRWKYLYPGRNVYTPVEIFPPRWKYFDISTPEKIFRSRNC